MLSKAKYFLAVLLAVSIFASALPAQAALSVEQQNAVLSLLYSFGVGEDVITNVGGVVAGISTSASSGESDVQKTSPLQGYCPNLSVSMLRGARDSTTGGQVSELQRFLASYFGLNQSDIVTGYFGVLTQKYVVMLQQQNGLPTLGIVGPSTRALIAKLCGSVTPNVPPLCNLSSDKSQYVYGETVKVSWASQNTSYAEWIKDTSGKDNFYLGGDKLAASGSASFVANVIGNPFVTMRVHAPNDATATCALVIPVSDGTTPSATTTPASVISASLDASSPGLQFVAGGATNVTLGVFKVSNSGDEGVSIARMRLAIDDYNFNPADIASVTLWDGATHIGTAFFTPSQITPLGYDALVAVSQPFIVNGHTQKMFTIKANIAQIGTGQSGTSGHKIQIEPYYFLGTGTARGLTYETNYRYTGGAPVSYPAYLFKSFPTIGIGPEKLPYTGVEDGRLMRFTVTADSHGSVGLGKMVFNIQSTNASVTNGNLYGYTDPNFSSPISGFNADGSVPTSYTGSVYMTAPLSSVQIPAGATRYFEFRGSVSPSGNGASVTTTLLSDQNAVFPLQSGTSLREKDVNFVWSPNSNSVSSYSVSDWTGGYAVPGLPLAGFSYTRVGSSGTGTTTVPVQTNPVTASLAASATSVVSGQPVTLTWNSNLTQTDISYYSGGCGVEAQTSTQTTQITNPTFMGGNGSVTHVPSGDVTYTLTCISGGKDGSPSAKATVRVSVVSPTVQSPVISSFTAYPSYIYQKGVVTLSWKTTNANRCVLQYSGREVTVNTNGTYSAVQYGTVDYKLICTNDPGTGKDGPSTSAIKTVPYINKYLPETDSTGGGTSESIPNTVTQ